MEARHFVTFLAAVPFLSGSLVSLAIQVVAAGSATVWLVLAVARLVPRDPAGLGWDAARPSREEQRVLRDFSDRLRFVTCSVSKMNAVRCS